MQESIQVKIGDSTLLEAASTGNVYLSAFDGEKWNEIVLKDVLFVPNYHLILFSTTAVYKSEILENGKRVIVAERSGGLFL